jgi:hypothetical protein
MGYSPKLWGKQAWHFIHMVALSYPYMASEETKKKYYDFYESLGHTLPCGTCAQHYKKKFEANPPRMENRNELFRWTVDIHNSVNKDIGKNQISYDKALSQLNSNKDNSITLGVAFSVSVITMISLFAYAMRKK